MPDGKSFKSSMTLDAELDQENVKTRETPHRLAQSRHAVHFCTNVLCRPAT
jgi:hypothetical protein